MDGYVAAKFAAMIPDDDDNDDDKQHGAKEKEGEEEEDKGEVEIMDVVL